MVNVYDVVKKIFVEPKTSVNSSSDNDEQQGQGLKILTPKQMSIRLPILLAQLKAGNNSQQLKNEIRLFIHNILIVYIVYIV